ncbi:MAG: HEPN domain protein [Methanosaeta sp. PtaB.Bin018]|jgi:HEPN domain-containing protein|nr:HEPN domain-containing protein [Methanothrix sp.]OPX77305.1 MAG: HEPN domain protein [Methanosaeta sp. PtaB.Bin018]
MKSDESTKRMISRATIIVEEAEYLQRKQAWNMVVRRSQEVVELALKAALIWAQIEVPRIHDVGPLLKQYADRYPEPFRSRIHQLASISRMLRAEREISFYGDEQSGVPPESLYTPEDAKEALLKAHEVLSACQDLIGTTEAE